MRALCPHVITSIRIEDDGTYDKLTSNVASVEEKIGHSLRRNHSTNVVTK